MRGLFDELKRDGSDAIHRWIDERKQETVQLDFKTKIRPEHGELDKNDRAVIGPPLSALANSAGGLLVIGVQTTKSKSDKIDAASKAAPIKDIARFKNDAIRATAELLMPRHPGIEIEIVEEKSAPGSGYLAIWVERSERRPHRSEAAGDRHYYKRSGDSSFIMEHYDVEDAFKRTTVATLELGLEQVIAGQAETVSNLAAGSIQRLDVQDFRLRFGLRNVSTVSARAPYVRVSSPFGCTPIAVVTSLPNVRPPKLSLEQQSVSSGTMFFGDAVTLLHPELHLPAFDLSLRIVRPQATQWHHNNVPLVVSAMSFDFAFGSQDARMVRGSFSWRGRELVKLLGNP
jgi:hypothetical protein